MNEQDPHRNEHTDSAESPGPGNERDDNAAHDAPAATPTAAEGRPEWRRDFAAGLIGALALTVFSLVFVVAFIGALHNPGPRSVPVGVVGAPTQAAALGGALDRAEPGAFVVKTYPSATAARDAILDRNIDAALVPGPPPQLLVATAAGQAVTNATVAIFTSAANSAGVNLPVVNVRPLHTSDPQGLSQVFFVIALLAPSVIFGNVLVKQISPGLHPLRQLAVIAVYAAIVSAVATAIADAAIGSLIGAPWGLFGIGTLLAFATAVVAAAVTRWTGTLGYGVIALLFIPIGISSSGTTLGPNMITQWYADLGKALPAGSALPAVQNTIYFNANATVRPLLILSAWALAGAIALALVGVFRPPMPRQPGSTAPADHAAADTAEYGTADRPIPAEAPRESGRHSTPKRN